jgi:hypothetical protein
MIGYLDKPWQQSTVLSLRPNSQRFRRSTAILNAPASFTQPLEVQLHREYWMDRRELLGGDDERRRALPQHVKAVVWQRDGGRCVQCNADTLASSGRIPAPTHQLTPARAQILEEPLHDVANGSLRGARGHRGKPLQ